jgi:hypothetical protein
VASLAGYFIGLHALEAWFLRRLLVGEAPVADGGQR